MAEKIANQFTGVDMHGSIACNEKKTRSTDNSAKYHVDLRAKDYGTPEGLSRMLDILAKASTPRAITTTMNEQKAVEDTGKPKESSTPEEKKAGKA